MTDIAKTQTTEPESAFTAEDWERANRENRRAIMRIDAERIRYILDLPAGVRFRSVRANWELDSIEVMVEGPALDACHPDTELRRLNGDMHYDAENQRLRYLPWKPEEAA